MVLIPMQYADNYFGSVVKVVNKHIKKLGL